MPRQQKTLREQLEQLKAEVPIERPPSWFQLWKQKATQAMNDAKKEARKHPFHQRKPSKKEEKRVKKLSLKISRILSEQEHIRTKLNREHIKNLEKQRINLFFYDAVMRLGRSGRGVSKPGTATERDGGDWRTD